MITTAVVGSRDEAVALAPVIRGLRSEAHRVRVLARESHTGTVPQLLETLEALAPGDLEVWRELDEPGGWGQASSTATTAVDIIGADLAITPPDVVLVHGHGSAAFAGALGGFYAGVPVANVGAGLTSAPGNPAVPEQANRQLMSRLTSWHFAATSAARVALLHDGVPPDTVEVVGSTTVDNLGWTLERGLGASAFGAPRRPGERRRLLVVMHQNQLREGALAAVAHSVGLLATGHDLEVVMPLPSHRGIRQAVVDELIGCPGVRLPERLSYPDLAATLADCDLVMTDSAGVQEAAPGLGRPTLVLRATTDRPEAVWAGCAEVVGTRRAEVEAAASRLLTDRAHFRRMSIPAYPFGDGHAAERVVAHLLDHV
ncbi:UDP-N-acetylglucosamine 2-epimerase (non-hydrolyzing) [Nocardioides mangrovicus]|uniref:UDP-N-acetylglucosamine 2-epimerase (non-hydrolyzing) n=1 Tax=Nocardioides mangrovicus TaxID=2478913 RepID=A0A3L8P0Y2_9ACTN|nr:UDP-N-acetylglucosamine 2-epimerase (non-hydrolyzing) [Nocardioides mangrovicus]RLV48552.1 UDP-N-acetylglucosamine 2-epimerase (non-hydrolyzing) [Nocardioides mangrovicus]